VGVKTENKMSQSFRCDHCHRDVYESVLDDTNGYCAYCDEFIRPTTEVLEQWKAVRQGTSGGWEDIQAAIAKYDFDALGMFLHDKNAISINRLNLLNRVTDSGVSPYMNPDEIHI